MKTLLLVALTVVIGSVSASADLSRTDCNTVKEAMSLLELSTSRQVSSFDKLNLAPLEAKAAGDNLRAIEAVSASLAEVKASMGRFLAALQDMNYRLQVCSR